MAVQKKQDIKQPHEYKGLERVFRVDRDTLLIYTGKEREDQRPFIRFGGGSAVYTPLVPLLDSSVLPETGLWNIGHELIWLETELDQTGDVLRYVGNKDRMMQLHNAHKLMVGERKVEQEKGRVKLDPYLPPRHGGNEKDQAQVTFMANGNVTVYAHGSKVIDIESYNKNKLRVDREYDLMQKALQKEEPRFAGQGYGFLYSGVSDGTTVTLLHKFNEELLLAHPHDESQFTTYQMGIEPDRISMALGRSVFEPGIMEQVRRKSVSGGSLALYTIDSERIIIFKKIYEQATVAGFEDSRPLPEAKEAVFFATRGRTHGLFALKLGAKAEDTVHIEFPLGRRDGNRSYEYIRPPHNLNFAVLNSRKALKESHSRLTLFERGSMSERLYGWMRLASDRYPLVPNREYRYQFGSHASELQESLFASLADTVYEAPLRQLFAYGLTTDVEDESIREVLRAIRRLPKPKDIAIRNNLHEAIRLISYLPAVQSAFTPFQKKSLGRLQRRFSISWSSFSNWLTLGDEAVRFELLFLANKATFLLVVAEKRQPFSLPYLLPPSVEEIELSPLEYAAYLKEQNKQLDKMFTVPASRRLHLDFAEKLYQERLAMVEDRRRLSGLVAQLSSTAGAAEPTAVGYRLALPEWMPEWMKNLIEGAYERLPGRRRSSSDSSSSSIATGAAAPSASPGRSSSSSGEGMRRAGLFLLLLPLAAILAALLWIGGSRIGSADSAAEQGSSSQSDLAALEQLNSSGEPQLGMAPLHGGSAGELAPFLSSEQPEQSQALLAANPQLAALSAEEILLFNGPLPNSDSIEPTMREIMEYSNVLAEHNGFATIQASQAGVEELRNPNLVFPGDRLVMPDGRNLSIESGQTIWQIATSHYRADSARFNILSARLQVLHDDYQKKKKLMPQQLS